MVWVDYRSAAAVVQASHSSLWLAVHMEEAVQHEGMPLIELFYAEARHCMCLLSSHTPMSADPDQAGIDMVCGPRTPRDQQQAQRPQGCLYSKARADDHACHVGSHPIDLHWHDCGPKRSWHAEVDN